MGGGCDNIAGKYVNIRNRNEAFFYTMVNMSDTLSVGALALGGGASGE